jgi:hypothetical protein
MQNTKKWAHHGIFPFLLLFLLAFCVFCNMEQKGESGTGGKASIFSLPLLIHECASEQVCGKDVTQRRKNAKCKRKMLMQDDEMRRDAIRQGYR